MIPASVVEEVKRLLAEGRLSQRKIARQTGVSRGSVGLIAQGKRPDYQPRRDLKEDLLGPAGPPERCPSCGAMVYVPCRLCRLRELLATSAPLPGLGSASGPVMLGLQLNDEHRVRYEEIRRRRGWPSREDRQWEVVS